MPAERHDIDFYVAAVVGRLREQTAHPVHYFPEQPSQFRLTDAKGAYLVSVLGRDYEQPRGSAGGWREYRLRIQLTVVSRALSAGNHAAYTMLDEAYHALAGWRVNDRPLAPEREFFLSQEADLWKYAAIYALSHVRLR